MKECKYCGSVIDNHIVNCPNCGAEDFWGIHQVSQQREHNRQEDVGPEHTAGQGHKGGIGAGLLVALLLFVLIDFGLYCRDQISDSASTDDVQSVGQSALSADEVIIPTFDEYKDYEPVDGPIKLINIEPVEVSESIDSFGCDVDGLEIQSSVKGIDGVQYGQVAFQVDL